MRRNPVDTSRPEDEQNKQRRQNHSKIFQTRQIRGCVYCDSNDHKANDCQKVTTVSDRKQILTKKRLCFNCALGSHRAVQCQSKSSCQNCHRRHHTSICDRPPSDQAKKVVLTPSGVGEGVFHVVFLKVDGIITRPLIDTGGGSSCVSTKVGDMLNKKPIEPSTKRVEMLMGSRLTKMETYEVVVESLDNSFRMDVKLTKVNKSGLLSIDNPHYEKVKAKYCHLGQVNMADKDTKDQLPIHVILSVEDCARIKNNKSPLIGQAGEPVAKYTKLGWIIISPDNEFNRQAMFLTQTSQVD